MEHEWSFALTFLQKSKKFFAWGMGAPCAP